MAEVGSTAESLDATRSRSPGCAGRRTYIRRKPGQTALHQVVREHLETLVHRVSGAPCYSSGHPTTNFRTLLTNVPPLSAIYLYKTR